LGEVVFPLVEALGRQVVSAELDEVRGVGSEDHLAIRQLPRHDSYVVALLFGSTPVHGNTGHAIGHSLRGRVLK